MRDYNHLGLYPVNIRQCRYQGLYSKGAWVLTTGTHEPDKDTDAFASDVECLDFWRKREIYGPVVKRDLTLITAFSGGTPEECIDQLDTFIDSEFPECEECGDPRALGELRCRPCDLKAMWAEKDTSDFLE